MENNSSQMVNSTGGTLLLGCLDILSLPPPHYSPALRPFHAVLRTRTRMARCTTPLIWGAWCSTCMYCRKAKSFEPQLHKYDKMGPLFSWLLAQVNLRMCIATSFYGENRWVHHLQCGSRGRRVGWTRAALLHLKPLSKFEGRAAARRTIVCRRALEGRVMCNTQK